MYYETKGERKRRGRSALFCLGVFLSVVLVSCAPAAPTVTIPTVVPTPQGKPAASATEGQAKVQASPVAPTPAPPVKTERVRLQVVTKSISFYPFFFGKDKGFYQAEGIDLELVTMAANLAVPGLLSGDIDFAGVSTTSFTAGLKGAGIKLLLATISAPPWHLIGKKGVATAADLKGGKVGVMSIGSTDHFVTTKALVKLGLDPAKDVTFVQIEARSILQAVRAGSVEAATLSQPDTAMAMKDGFKDIIFTRDVTPMAVDGLGVTDKKLKENPDQIKRMLRATVKTLRYMKEHRDELVQAVARDFNVDQGLAQTVWDDQVNTLSSTGLLSDEGIKAMTEAALFSGEIKGDLSPDRGADFSLLRGVLGEMGIRE